MELLDVLRCPLCCKSLAPAGPTALACSGCGRRYPIEQGIPLMLADELPGGAAKRRESQGWVALAREEEWYEPDDEVDAHLPFLGRDLGWEDPTWRANEHSFSLLVSDYVQPGQRILEVGAAKCWAAQHLLPLRCEYIGSDMLVDPLIGLGRGAFYAEQVGEFPRVQADGEHLPFADSSFDLSFCVATLHHALDLRRMARELARVTRPGGTVAALNEGTRPLWARRNHPEQKREKALGINEHVHTLATYLAAFARAGLRLRRLEQADGDHGLAARRVGRLLLRLPRGGRTLAVLYTSVLCGYSSVSIYASKPQ